MTLAALAIRRKITPLVEQATTKLMTKYHFMTIEETEEIYYYKDGVYVPGGEKLIAKETEEMFHFDLRNNHLTEIKGHISRLTYVKHEQLDADINTINLKNGLYDIDNDRLLEHTPAYYSINQKPIVYDKDAKPKRFVKFLQEVLYPKEILTAIDAMAYTFHRDYTIETIFILFGFGNNGKSVYTTVLTSMHGVDNCSNVPLTEMLSDKFALSDLEAKDVNIDNELAGQTIKETGVIKRLTGGTRQRIRIQRKNQKAYDTTLYAKLFFNANRMPDSQDTTDAHNRRITSIAFPITFEGKSEDKQLTSKLTEETEISAIFNILMRALRRIRRDKEIYVNEKTIEEKRLKYERTVNPIKSFLEEAISSEDSEESSQLLDYLILKEELHQAYEKYCKKYMLPVEKFLTFCSILKVKFGLPDIRKVSKKDKTKKLAYWRGILLVPEFAPKKAQKTMDEIDNEDTE